ncbi:MAG TPA: tyrosine-type recombinase/integrase [Alphaproteobacteria bacterium]|nr:tyrosine-type recombinase/integrase [Alphaproteobacteria bacterium]
MLELPYPLNRVLKIVMTDLCSNSSNPLNDLPAFFELLKVWQDRMLYQKGFSVHTVNTYKNDMLNFVSFFKNEGCQMQDVSFFKDLSLQDFRSWLYFRHRENYSPRSTARALSSLKSFFTFLKKEKGIDNKALEFVSRPKIPKALPKALSEHETFLLIKESALLDERPWVNQRDKAILMLLYGAGLRISEALNLKGGCLEQGDGLLIEGKGKKQRQVPLLQEVKEALQEYKKLCPYDLCNLSPFFRAIRGGALTSTMVQKRVQALRELLNLPASTTPHALRHSCATHLLNQSDDLRSIQALLGHESLSTTQIYTKVADSKLFKQYENFHPRSKNRL